MNGLLITGLVAWGAAPVPGAHIVLKAPGDFYKLPAVLETTTNADGWFELHNPPVGDWYLYAEPPGNEFTGWTGHPISVAANQWVDGGRFQLTKPLQLLEPNVGAELATLTPVLRWASFPEAASYHVDVFNDVTGEAVMRQRTDGTRVAVNPALAPHVWYQWAVHALNPDNLVLASSPGWIFMVRDA